MICPKCKAGGDASALARLEDARADIAELLRATARKRHAECTGCECQHRERKS
jgi:hypothetical protein